MQTVRFDVWGGESSMDHVARAHYTIDDQAWRDRASTEMAGGFLVNLRVLGAGEGWGPNEDFDERTGSTAGHA